MNNISYIIIACYIDKGMKSKGSKCLIEFNRTKLLDYQIDQIEKNHKNKNDYEIIVISDFEYIKILKQFSNKAKIVSYEQNKNPIAQGCTIAKYKNIFFIDYGCVFINKSISKLDINQSFILSIKSNKNTAKKEVGAIINDQNSLVEHMFFDLLDHYFTNIFFLIASDSQKIINDKHYHRFNLLYFEIINSLIASGSKIYNQNILNNEYIYFNNMDQKNGISKFIKKHSLN